MSTEPESPGSFPNPYTPITPAVDPLQRAQHMNRLLLGTVVALLVVMAGGTGWVLGTRQGGSTAGAVEHGAGAHTNCPFDVPTRGIAILRGTHCMHGTPMVDAHCDQGHAVKKYILELLNQGLSDEQIEAALLRRYGDQALAGREWLPQSRPAG